MGQTRSRLGRGVISFRLSVVSQAAASLADWHRLQSNELATGRRTSRRRRRRPLCFITKENALYSRFRPRVRVSGHRLHLLRPTVAAQATATIVPTAAAATTTTRLQDHG